MKTLKIQDYDMPAIVTQKYLLDNEYISHEYNIDNWEKVKLGIRLQIPVYFYPCSENERYPENDTTISKYNNVSEIIIQYRKEYTGYIMIITKTK